MANNGVKFEQQIVECYRRRNFEKHTPEVVAATRMLIEKFSNAKIVHRDEIKLKGLGREVKADFWMVIETEQWIGISVKMDGQVQLSSAEGKKTAEIFDQVSKSLQPEQRTQLQRLIEPIRTLPRTMVAEKNRPKAKSRKPHLISEALNYDVWKEQSRPEINTQVREVFQDRQIREAVVEEMLTGRKQFAGTVGVAEYILTPKYFKYVSKKYVQSISEYVKIDVRGKSRAGISSGVVRFDSKI